MAAASARRGTTASITSTAPIRSITDQTAARSPNRLCWLRTGAPASFAAISAALPRYCCDTIRGVPPTRADSTR